MYEIHAHAHAHALKRKQNNKNTKRKNNNNMSDGDEIDFVRDAFGASLDEALKDITEQSEPSKLLPPISLSKNGNSAAATTTTTTKRMKNGDKAKAKATTTTRKRKSAQQTKQDKKPISRKRAKATTTAKHGDDGNDDAVEKQATMVKVAAEETSRLANELNAIIQQQCKKRATTGDNDDDSTLIAAGLLAIVRETDPRPISLITATTASEKKKALLAIKSLGKATIKSVAENYKTNKEITLPDPADHGITISVSASRKRGVTFSISSNAK